MGFGADHGDEGTGQFDEMLRQYNEAVRRLDASLEERDRQHRRDKAELAWWRQVFSCRFRDGNLPPVGTALYGARFVLMEENEPDGELREWTR